VRLKVGGGLGVGAFSILSLKGKERALDPRIVSLVI
jgi:hypothetical protein